MFHPVKSRSFTHQSLPTRTGDAKAELNRRGQACEIPAGTGVRVAKT